MRKIVINRKKSVAGCAGKVLIYTIENFEADMPITKDQCNYLGSIKNDSVLESVIPESEITIIAAYDNFGLLMITDHMVIPQGTEDIVVNGKVKSNPLHDNPFIFER